MKTLERKIKNLTEALQSATAHQNYYASLTMALTLPDICSKLQYPEEKKTGTRYSKWFDEYMLSRYQKRVGYEKTLHTFLSGMDCYALRCSLLHQFETDITQQGARKVLENFTFVQPQVFGPIHMNQINNQLQLQVDVFCLDILLSVEQWLGEYKEDEAINERAENLMEIQSSFTF
ncbi:hypothetical protein [Planococcus rifietoensis]|uniref:hypothetical protein n=1 Tax=Planococcus rifietoensis TaxID=200991 RepID=UPI00384C7759